MTPEQIERLEALREKVVEQFLHEANPANWPAVDSARGRGDRFWMKKNATATAELLTDLTDVIAKARAATKASVDDVIAREAAQLERVGASVLDRRRLLAVTQPSDDDGDDEDPESRR
jgi:hypothetical protein